jgi:hypothetical protein
MVNVTSERPNLMLNPKHRSLYIDIRRSAVALVYGSLARADAYIPYVATDTDEWIDCIEAYKKRSNNLFLQQIDDLVMERGFNRNSSLSLITSSYKQGVMAANLLTVAGYENVIVELDRSSAVSGCSDTLKENKPSSTHCCVGYQWIDPTSRLLSGLLH